MVSDNPAQACAQLSRRNYG